MTSPTRTAVIIQYFELNNQYLENFIFFLSAAYRKDVDFYCLIAGPLSITLPRADNISFIYTKNFGHDFGSFANALNNGLDVSGYSHLIFINSSIRGPLLPPYYHGSWTYLFTDQLRGNTHLCGSSINILEKATQAHAAYKKEYKHEQPYSHVQTPAFAMSQECFQYLREIGIWNNCESMDKIDAIIHCEIRISQEVKAHGWDLGCILAPYDWIDYSKPHINPNLSTKSGHPLERDTYFGNTLHPYEVVFIKSNWGIIDQESLDLYSHVSLKARPSLLTAQWSEARKLKFELKQRYESRFPSPQLSTTQKQSEFHHKTTKKPFNSPQKTCILILGMHRSGTSALAGCLTLLGCKAPIHLMEANQNNIKGFFESEYIFALNEKVLQIAGMGWLDYQPYSWQWLTSDRGIKLMAEAEKILTQEFGAANLCVLKDPRISRLLPFWLKVLNSAQYKIAPLLLYRHPLEVGNSLRKRDKLELAYAELLWLRYVLDSEIDTRGLERTVLSYDQLMRERHTILDKIAKSCALPLPDPGSNSRVKIFQSINDFLSVDLRHHSAGTDNRNGQATGTLACWIEETYQILQRLAAGNSQVSDLRRLDTIRYKLHEASAVFGPMIRVAP